MVFLPKSFSHYSGRLSLVLLEIIDPISEQTAHDIGLIMQEMMSSIDYFGIYHLVDSLRVAHDLTINHNILHKAKDTSNLAFRKASLSTNDSSFSTQFLPPL